MPYYIISFTETSGAQGEVIIEAPDAKFAEGCTSMCENRGVRLLEILQSAEDVCLEEMHFISEIENPNSIWGEYLLNGRAVMFINRKCFPSQ